MGSVFVFVVLSVRPFVVVFSSLSSFRPLVVNYNPRLSSVSLVSKTPNKKSTRLKRVPLSIEQYPNPSGGHPRVKDDCILVNGDSLNIESLL